MPAGLEEVLDRFVSERKFEGKGPLCVALVVTRRARETGLPLDPEALVTRGGGQVRGLGRGAVQSILRQHGIERVLAAEGGRTSRNSLHNMREYVAFLNELRGEDAAALDAIEAYWIGRVRAFFAAKPFAVRLDPSRGLRHVVRDLLDQAFRRQRDASGMNYAGAMLQHLVGAKLDCALGAGKDAHRSFSTADAPGNLVGDFSVGDAAIHVTTAPGEAVIARCADNLNGGFKPVLVTTEKGAAVAEGLAENKGLAGRIDIFGIEQFVALNLYEWGAFEAQGRRAAVEALARRYNEIVEDAETDPSLKIEIQG